MFIQVTFKPETAIYSYSELYKTYKPLCIFLNFGIKTDNSATWKSWRITKVIGNNFERDINLCSKKRWPDGGARVKNRRMNERMSGFIFMLCSHNSSLTGLFRPSIYNKANSPVCTGNLPASNSTICGHYTNMNHLHIV